MNIRKFRFLIGGYFGNSYTLVYKKGKLEYRCFHGVDSVFEFNVPVVKKWTEEDKEHDEIILQKNSADEDIKLEEIRFNRFLSYLKVNCENWKEE